MNFLNINFLHSQDLKSRFYVREINKLPSQLIFTYNSYASMVVITFDDKERHYKLKGLRGKRELINIKNLIIGNQIQDLLTPNRGYFRNLNEK